MSKKDESQKVDDTVAAAKDAAEFAKEAVKEAAHKTGAAAEAVVDAVKAGAQDAAAEAQTATEESTQEMLEAAKAHADEWQDKFVRLHAEWDTYRRRTTEQRAEEKARAAENLVSSLLPVIDDFERTIDYAKTNGEGGLLEGVEAVHAKLVGVLQSDGVSVIDPLDQAFDALEHQAVSTVEDKNVPDETVSKVFQRGYKMGGKVIRPAMVSVSSGGPKREPEDKDDKE